MDSIRGIVKDTANEVYSQDLLPDRAVDLRRKLSSIYGNILDVIQESELKYNRVLLGCLDQEKAATKARIIAETSPEYQALVEAKNTQKMTDKMLSALNTFIRSKEKEFDHGKNV